MKKYILALVLIGAVSFLFFTKKGQIVKDTALTYVSTPNYIQREGNTVTSRILVPDGFKRAYYEPGTFPKYLQDYALKEYGTKVINYDGKPYVYQAGHVGVLEVPVPSNGLQQCADALMRLRAEYLWDTGQKSKIGFNFTSGHYCSWLKYAEGFRPKINGNKVTFHKTAGADASKKNFYKYLNLIYTYAGTQSLYSELPKVSEVDQLEVGDMLVTPGFPGHIIMIVDKATNANGNNLFIFAQGNTPAQSVHILKNPSDTTISPWFELEMGAALQIPTYYFNKSQFIRFK
ncbi:hypothetical protein SCB49_04020 [unidentified eubacterium SCB49]|nr:hypothetical protein SCB49_04020 [unidentified eubacterium SCB49]